MKKDYSQALRQAVKAFWSIRDSASRVHGQRTGRRDAGNRSAVTSGGHLNGFIEIIVSIIHDAGVDETSVFYKGHGSTILPGYFRATKDWDIVVVSGGRLIACIELKSQVGSFGNNFNNRAEESIGNATDLWTAYREGAFKGHTKPFLGYLIVLEDSEQSTRPVRVTEPHFNVFHEFKNASYETRYQLLCTRLVRERLYDGACLLLADPTKTAKGEFREPATELAFHSFAAALWAHANTAASTEDDPWS